MIRSRCASQRTGKRKIRVNLPGTGKPAHTQTHTQTYTTQSVQRGRLRQNRKKKQAKKGQTKTLKLAASRAYNTVRI